MVLHPICEYLVCSEGPDLGVHSEDFLNPSSEGTKLSTLAFRAAVCFISELSTSAYACFKRTRAGGVLWSWLCDSPMSGSIVGISTEAVGSLWCLNTCSETMSDTISNESNDASGPPYLRLTMTAGVGGPISRHPWVRYHPIRKDWDSCDVDTMWVPKVREQELAH